MTDKVTKSVYNKTTAVSDDTKYRQEKNSWIAVDHFLLIWYGSSHPCDRI